MRLIAREGMDVLLVRMPFRLAIFGVNKANNLISRYDYNAWYIGGHSLGGAMAANYAAEHGEQLKGLILLAAYPTKPLDDWLTAISICGSADVIINREKMSDGDVYLPEKAVKCVIDGGNHAQFGNYGEQAGDGEPSITSEEQQRQTAEMIIKKQMNDHFHRLLPSPRHLFGTSAGARSSFSCSQRRSRQAPEYRSNTSRSDSSPWSPV